MDAASKQDAEQRAAERLNVAIRFAPFVSFLVTLVALLSWANGNPIRTPTSANWPIPAAMVGAMSYCFVALIVGYGVRLMLQPGTVTPPNGAPPFSRDRIALYVVGAGTIGIVTTGLAAILTPHSDPLIGQSILSVFTAVLPVFSTWVGTVLAAYFSNESFRQASDAANSVATSGSDTASVTRSGTMVPFDRIIRYEMKPEDVKGKTMWDAAAAIPYKNLETLFQPPGVVRIVVFDDKRHPVYVLRHDTAMSDEQKKKLLTAKQSAPDLSDEQKAALTMDNLTLGDVMVGAAKDAARNFAWTAASALVVDAKRLFELRKVTDLFVTQNGRTDEAVLGWVPDDNVRAAS